MELACGYCEGTQLEPGDGIVRCLDCGRTTLAPAAREARQRAVPLGLPDVRRRRARGAPGEVSSGPAALVAIVLTILFYGILRMLPPARVTDLFLDRGWVPYVITGVAAWALVLLGARLVRLRREGQALARQLVHPRPDGTLGPQDAAAALAALQASAQGVEDSFLVARLERALRHFQTRRRVVEVVEYLTAESSADEGRVDASYALVRVFVWVVPTLGFIGTVIGIGAAVGGFSETLEAARSLEGMKASIGSVTGGLGVAFDTTLLALVMSILIMFPASAVQRFEESFLTEIDDYCTEHLIPCLRDEPAASVDGALVDALAERLAVALRTTAPESA
jgi:biopolymer transport protein ExbB/TolQ